MKICYVLPGCGVSGGIAVVCQHANRLMARGHEVCLVIDGVCGDMSWFPGQRVPVVPLEQYQGDADILVATAWATSFAVAGLPARRKFYFVQSDETRFHPEDSVWRDLTAISYCFDFEYLTEARWIQRWLKDEFGHNATLVPNGLDPALFHPCPPLEAKGKRPRVLLEGAIGLPYKGMAEAFAAVQPLDVEIWCVSSLGRPDPAWRCDRFFEQVPMDMMKAIYSSCDILLKLSRVEGFFGPPLEMMACGGVCVVGRVTGHDEYIVEGKNALVVDPEDIEAARAAVQRLLEDTRLVEELKNNGLITASQWSWNETIDTLNNIYEKSGFKNSGPSYKIDKNSSIASLFQYCRLCESGAGLLPADSSIGSSPAERLSQWLKRKKLFHVAAHVAFWAHRLFKRGRIFLLRVITTIKLKS